MRRAALYFVPLAAACAAALAPGVATGDAPTKTATAADVAFSSLASPTQANREEGVQALAGMLPGIRGRLIEELPRAAWSVQVHLIEVLARDDAEASLKAVLGHLERTDETQAALIRDALLRRPATTDRLLAAYRADTKAFLRAGAPGEKARRRRAELAVLLQRAEIEQLFLSRKSKSGSTGYYDGQYDVLKKAGAGAAYRRLALEVMTGIALDEAVPMPGRYRTGVYEFLRPHHIDQWELRSMALNAVSELCTPDDMDIVARLRRRLIDLDAKRQEWHAEVQLLANRYATRSTRFQSALVEWDDAIGQYTNVLTCLYVITQDMEIHDRVEIFLYELESYRYPVQPIAPMATIAGILIRVGWYQRAINAFERTKYQGSLVLAYYNQACAYASWSRDESQSETERSIHRHRALRALERSVENGWSDIGWMTEDRDLDPIRDTDRYRALVKQIERRLKLPDDD